MTIAFYIWGVLGLFINGMNFVTQTGSVGVGTSAYLMVGNLIWIGGMLLFGLGAVIHKLPHQDAPLGEINIEKK
jgi:hypothetical protein